MTTLGRMGKTYKNGPLGLKNFFKSQNSTPEKHMKQRDIYINTSQQFRTKRRIQSKPFSSPAINEGSAAQDL